MLSNPSRNAAYFDGCECSAETDKAIRVYVPDIGEEVWVPKSQIHDDSEVYRVEDEGTLAVARWWAEKQGWI